MTDNVQRQEASLMTAKKIRKSFRAKKSPEDFLDGAIETGKWIRSQEHCTNNGSWWEPHPILQNEGQIDLMHGNAGIILFFITLADASGNKSYLNDAKRGADYAVNMIKNRGTDFLVSGMAGNHYRSGTKYTLVSGGAAGVAYALTELNRALDEPVSEYRETVISLTDEIIKNAVSIPEGITWSRKSGFNFDSGTILYLLYAAEHYKHAEWVETAVNAGKAILSTGTKQKTGGTRFVGFTNMVKAMTGSDDPDADVPNFCYGSAGIGYTFARLYQVSRHESFLDAAREAAHYAESLTEAHFRGVGMQEVPKEIIGMEHTAFSSMFYEGAQNIDIEETSSIIRKRAAELVSKHPEIGAIVLECTNMPPFAKAVQEETGLPVFDIISLIKYVHLAVVQTEYKGYL